MGGESVIVTIKMFSLDLDFCLKQAYNKKKRSNKRRQFNYEKGYVFVESMAIDY